MSCPPERDVKIIIYFFAGFHFRQLLKVKAASFEEDRVKNRLSLVAVSSPYDLVFVGCETGFKVLKTDALLSKATEVQKLSINVVDDFAFTKNVQLHTQPVYLGVSFDSSLLAVCIYKHEVPFALVYDICVFHDQSPAEVAPYLEIRLGTSPNVKLQDAQWNPGSDFPSLLATVLSDGSCALWDVKDSLTCLASLPATTMVTCINWSPKGKQLLGGCQDGRMVQFDQALKVKKEVTPPPGLFGSDTPTVLDILWESTYVFVAAFLPQSATDAQPCVVHVTCAKGAPVSYRVLEDLCFGTGQERQHRYYFCILAEWKLVVAASANALEASVIGKNPNNEAEWERWNLEDTGRAELPMTDDYRETYPLGVGISLSATQPIALGDNMFFPASPILLLYSSEGVLSAFHMLNYRPGLPSLQVPRQMLNGQGARQNPALLSSAQPAAQSASQPAAAPSKQPPSQPATQTATQPATQQAPPQSQQQVAEFGQSTFGTKPNVPDSKPEQKPFGQSSAGIFGQTSPTSGSAANQNNPSFLGQGPPTSGSAANQNNPSILGQALATVSAPSSTNQNLFGNLTKPTATTAAPAGNFLGFQAFGATPTSGAKAATIFDGTGSTFGGAGSTFGGTGSIFGGTGSAVGGKATGFSGTTTTIGGTAPNFGGPAPTSIGGTAPTIGGTAPTFGSPASTFVGGTAPTIGGSSVTPQKPTASIATQPQNAAPTLPTGGSVVPPTSPKKPADTQGSLGNMATTSRAPAPGFVNLTGVGAPFKAANENAAQRISEGQGQTSTPVKTEAKSAPAPNTTPGSAGRKRGRGSADPFSKAVQEEMLAFSDELNDLINRSKNLDLDIGSHAQMEQLKTMTADMTQFCEEVKATTKSLNEDIHELKYNVLESFAAVEESRALHDMRGQPTYNRLLASRDLDPVSARALRRVHTHYQFLQAGIADVDEKLDAEWQAYQKDKKGSKPLQVPALDMIYRTLTTNQRVLDTYNNTMSALSTQLNNLRVHNTASQWNGARHGHTPKSGRFVDTYNNTRSALSTKLNNLRVHNTASQWNGARHGHTPNRNSVPALPHRPVASPGTPLTGATGSWQQYKPRTLGRNARNNALNSSQIENTSFGSMGTVSPCRAAAMNKTISPEKQSKLHEFFSQRGVTRVKATAPANLTMSRLLAAELSRSYQESEEGEEEDENLPPPPETSTTFTTQQRPVTQRVGQQLQPHAGQKIGTTPAAAAMSMGKHSVQPQQTEKPATPKTVAQPTLITKKPPEISKSTGFQFNTPSAQKSSEQTVFQFGGVKPGASAGLGGISLGTSQTTAFKHLPSPSKETFTFNPDASAAQNFPALTSLLGGGGPGNDTVSPTQPRPMSQLVAGITGFTDMKGSTEKAPIKPTPQTSTPKPLEAQKPTESGHVPTFVLGATSGKAVAPSFGGEKPAEKADSAAPPVFSGLSSGKSAFNFAASSSDLFGGMKKSSSAPKMGFNFTGKAADLTGPKKQTTFSFGGKDAMSGSVTGATESQGDGKTKGVDKSTVGSKTSEATSFSATTFKAPSTGLFGTMPTTSAATRTESAEAVTTTSSQPGAKPAQEASLLAAALGEPTTTKPSSGSFFGIGTSKPSPVFGSSGSTTGLFGSTTQSSTGSSLSSTTVSSTTSSGRTPSGEGGATSSTQVVTSSIQGATSSTQGATSSTQGATLSTQGTISASATSVGASLCGGSAILSSLISSTTPATTSAFGGASSASTGAFSTSGGAVTASQGSGSGALSAAGASSSAGGASPSAGSNAGGAGSLGFAPTFSASTTGSLPPTSAQASSQFESAAGSVPSGPGSTSTSVTPVSSAVKAPAPSTGSISSVTGTNQSGAGQDAGFSSSSGAQSQSFGTTPASATPASAVSASAFGQTSVSAFGQAPAPVSANGTVASGKSSATSGVAATGSGATTTTGGNASGVFGGSASGSGLFGSQTTSSGLFGNQSAPASSSGVFGTPASSGAGIFSSQPSTTSGAFGNQPSSGSGVFGSSTTSATSTSGAFGNQTTTSSGIFGGQTTASSVFGGQPDSGLFGNSTSSSGVFGGSFGQTSSSSRSAFAQAGAPLFGGTSTSAFGGGSSTAQTQQTGSAFGSTSSQAGSSVFGHTSSQQSGGSVFGCTTPAASTPQAPTASSGWGSVFGGGGGGLFSGLGGKPSAENASKNVFGSTSFGGQTSGSQAAPNLFGTPSSSSSGGFGFGGGASSGGGGAFSGGGAGGGPFSGGGGAFSSGGGVAQTGFGGFGMASPHTPQQNTAGGFGGRPTFGSPLAFGAAASPGFGSAPIFGSPPGLDPTFGAGGSVFGQSASQSPTSGGFAAFAGSQVPSFGGMAQQSSTPGFGDLAQQPQQQDGGFGSPGFGGFGTPNQQSSFGGSFSSYRG